MGPDSVAALFAGGDFVFAGGDFVVVFLSEDGAAEAVGECLDECLS